MKINLRKILEDAFYIFLILLFFLLCWNQCHGQKIEWKKEIAPIALLFAGGAADGVAESVKWHYYSQFSETFPGNDAGYWNPDESWRNKYQGGDPESGPAYFGSTTFLAWTTDGYHLMRSTRNVMIVGAILLAPKKDCQNWKTIALRALIYTASYAAGFHLTYSLIIKP